MTISLPDNSIAIPFINICEGFFGLRILNLTTLSSFGRIIAPVEGDRVIVPQDT